MIDNQQIGIDKLEVCKKFEVRIPGYDDNPVVNPVTNTFGFEYVTSYFPVVSCRYTRTVDYICEVLSDLCSCMNEQIWLTKLGSFCQPDCNHMILSSFMIVTIDLNLIIIN